MRLPRRGDSAAGCGCHSVTLGRKALCASWSYTSLRQSLAPVGVRAVLCGWVLLVSAMVLGLFELLPSREPSGPHQWICLPSTSGVPKELVAGGMNIDLALGCSTGVHAADRTSRFRRSRCVETLPDALMKPSEMRAGECRRVSPPLVAALDRASCHRKFRSRHVKAELPRECPNRQHR